MYFKNIKQLNEFLINNESESLLNEYFEFVDRIIIPHPYEEYRFIEGISKGNTDTFNEYSLTFLHSVVSIAQEYIDEGTLEISIKDFIVKGNTSLLFILTYLFSEDYPYSGEDSLFLRTKIINQLRVEISEILSESEKYSFSLKNWMSQKKQFYPLKQDNTFNEPLDLIFDNEEFDNKTISDAIMWLSELYTSIGGGELIIDKVETFEVINEVELA